MVGKVVNAVNAVFKPVQQNPTVETKANQLQRVRGFSSVHIATTFPKGSPDIVHTTQSSGDYTIVCSFQLPLVLVLKVIYNFSTSTFLTR